MRRLWERASRRRRFSIRVRHGARPLALTLLAAGVAVGVLLQLGPASASPEQATRSPRSAKKQQALDAYGKIPLAFTANAGQSDMRVRYSAQGAGFSLFLTRKEAMLALQRPGKQGRGKGAAARASLPRRQPECRHPRRAPGAGPGQRLARKRPLQVVHRPAYLRARRLSQSLAGRGHGVRRAERQAEVRVPRPPRSARPGRQARLPRREAALARPAGTCASARRSASSAMSDPISYQLVRGRRVPVASSFALSRSGSRLRLLPRPRTTTAATRLSSTRASSIRDYLGGSSDDSGGRASRSTAPAAPT